MTEFSREISLDANATTPLSRAVLGAMHDCLDRCWGNPSSTHRAGMRSKQHLGAARAAVAALIGASPAEIVFTGSATEANHTAILGALAGAPERRHIVSSAVEHPSTLMLLDHLETRGVQVTRLGVDHRGMVDLAELDAAIREDTAIVSLLWANNETGVLFPIAEAAAIARRRGTLFHTDAVQAAGRIALDMSRVQADFLSLSGHKMHAAKGVGALFVRKGRTLPPLLFGHQERGRRGGTENLPAIVGFGVAAGEAAADLDTVVPRLCALRDRLERGLAAAIGPLRVNGAGTPRLCNTTSVRIEGVDAEVVLDRLDRAGIFASSGSACTAGNMQASHVLLAMGLSRAAALATIRFSLSRLNDATEVDRAIGTVAGIVAPLLHPTLESTR